MTTIREIARHLNLSITTVSRALDGYDDVAEATRLRVQQAAAQLGYVPNQAARQLRRQCSDTLGYILPSAAGTAQRRGFADSFFSEFIAGLGDETAAQGLNLLVSSAAPDSEAEKAAYCAWVQARKVDGILLNRVRLHDWRLRYLAEHDMPFASLENSLDGLDRPRVEVNNRTGMVELVTHLAQQGWRCLAMLSGTPELRLQAERMEGFRQGLQQNDLPFDSARVMHVPLTSQDGYAGAKSLLRAYPEIDALVCINDEVAFGALHAAHELGRQVGHDLAVTGFDGVQDAAHCQPPLTTLDQPVYQIARTLVRLLVEAIHPPAEPAPRVVSLRPILLVRASSLKL
ncbi:MAG TPA: LacI family DNA-binding transcriptional regulator [Anaerolineaceae bacterium]|nr:LacI family DNA-binding transcriptional regulator [Anaerolineaceae bacterium]